MKLNRNNVRSLLQSFDLSNLFIEELGWDRLRTMRTVAVGNDRYTLEPIAEKRGVEIYHCKPGTDGKIPDYPKRRKIDSELTKVSAEHLIVFTDRKKTTQIWQWMAREVGKAKACRQQVFYARTSGDALIQKLENIVFQISDEEAITLTDVGLRLKDAFDREKLTKRFYDLFKAEHDSFLKFIDGIPDEEIARWYTSVMINRLMFIYFIQAKGFLAGDNRYLREKLNKSSGQYYREFLCPLFFEGFAKREKDRTPELQALLGRVPYLNGGLFSKHQIEEQYGQAIEIADAAFNKLFKFFDSYNWHLDERPLADGNEINPDVLGYIFEKYINKKQMGAYYTKEDITEYISKHAILPFVLDEARKSCRVAFEAPHSVWSILATDPDRYIYDAVLYGIDCELPENISVGIDDVALRGGWNSPASGGYALPTETWRETVARRQRCKELRDTLAHGEINSANDLIKYNLNIRQFVQDLVERWEGADLVKAIWDILNGTQDRVALTVLDPTCGSGAFLFAALETLEPVYEACLDKMEAFVADANQLGHSKDHQRFRDILDDVATHANRRYFIYKRIIVNNLYGVDIMEEATEICKLRLFLKLAAQVDPDTSKDNIGIEPLPDIDFNIRHGNTLVGFATESQIKVALTGSDQISMDFDDKWLALEAKLKANAKLFETFQKSQTSDAWTPEESALHKKLFNERKRPLQDDLDKQMGYAYGQVTAKSLEAWRKTTQPFHWFLEFYSVLKNGGFDVIIGNPPYVEYSEVSKFYKILGYSTSKCGNLYAYVMERCFSLASPTSRMGFIVPVSSVSTDGYASLQALLKGRDLYYSSFDDRPSRLFEGLEHIRLTIHIIGAALARPSYASTRYNKWTSAERPALFQTLQFTPSNVSLIDSSLPKLTCRLENSICAKLLSEGRPMEVSYSKSGTHKVLYSRKVGYFLQVLDFQPIVMDGSGQLRPPSEFKEIAFSTSDEAKAALAILNSNLFYWFVTVFSDCRHLNKREIDYFPIDLAKLCSGPDNAEMSNLALLLMADVATKSEHKIMRFKHDTLTVQCIYPKLSKAIIDNIDRILARHYDLSDEETDFLINYDWKYRMGRTAESATQDLVEDPLTSYG